jgi:hypothetical protein
VVCLDVNALDPPEKRPVVDAQFRKRSVDILVRNAAPRPLRRPAANFCAVLPWAGNGRLRGDPAARERRLEVANREANAPRGRRFERDVRPNAVAGCEQRLRPGAVAMSGTCHLNRQTNDEPSLAMSFVVLFMVLASMVAMVAMVASISPPDVQLAAVDLF